MDIHKLTTSNKHKQMRKTKINLDPSLVFDYMYVSQLTNMIMFSFLFKFLLNGEVSNASATDVRRGRPTTWPVFSHTIRRWRMLRFHPPQQHNLITIRRRWWPYSTHAQPRTIKSFLFLMILTLTVPNFDCLQRLQNLIH
ncbi:hypothetical protein PanWU01x14_123630 [Parasponia andersonii]|uniref:Transmembrane protein n=1 Tax=Parasponia andersonii TaxID=3476 RepID=A0A2P5CU62_PARAD|nr:hypothetical protein PanWU01x14_123630 [Parasponia andersonii]